MKFQNWKNLIAASALASIVIGCSAAPEEGAASESTPAALDESVDPTGPVIGATDDLLDLSCADFLVTAEVATAEEQDEAAVAAQDEIANGLIWVHGYLFAKNDGEIDVLSQNWMEKTAERVFATCSAAEDPSKLNLFEVASDEGA